MNIVRCRTLGAIVWISSSVGIVTAQEMPAKLAFDFTGGSTVAGDVPVNAGSVYSDEAGYGYEQETVAGGDRRSDPAKKRPTIFSVKVPEGNFRVKVTLESSSVPGSATVKAESGRLMLENVIVAAGEVVERSFDTNVRTARLPKLPTNATGREEVTLDQFDRGNTRDWDDRLSIEVVSQQTALRRLEITPLLSGPTVFLAGDSTVTDRDGGADVSWGQILPRFFKPGVIVSNQAQSGETLKSFANALRLDKILSQMKKGDYLFLQFGHNDSKASWPQTYAEAETTYKAYLRVYIAEARLRGGIPVLVTPMDRASRSTGAPTHGHGGYPEAMREVAREEHVALIDLYRMSITFYEAAGSAAPRILADGTHSTAYGGYEFAKCIVMGIRQNKLDLADAVIPDFRDFDPAHPDTEVALGLEHLFDGNEARRGDPGKMGTSPRLEKSVGAPTGKPGPGPL